jgi:hypothetical protein
MQHGRCPQTRLLLVTLLVLLSLGGACRHRPDSAGTPASSALSGSSSAGPAAPMPAANGEVTRQFGTSVQGRPMVAHVMGNGANKTLVIGAVHGNERNTVGLVELLHAYLRKHPEAWQGCTVIIAPCVNPDGWQLRSRRNVHGVDLNRNYPVGWRRIPSDSVYYSGPHPLSEPEAGAVLSLISEYRPQKIISVHGYAHMLLCEGDKPHQMAAAMSRFDHYPIRDSIGYPTPGSLGMYCAAKGDRQGVLTLELPHGRAERLWPQNRDALMAAIHLEIR